MLTSQYSYQSLKDQSLSPLRRLQFSFSFLIYFAVCAVLYYVRDKMKGDTDRIKDQGGKTRRKPTVEHEEQKIHKK